MGSWHFLHTLTFTPRRGPDMSRLPLIVIILLLLAVSACSGTPTPPPPSPSPTDAPTPLQPPPSDGAAIPWEEASAHIGEHGTVCGPVVATTYRPEIKGRPTWLTVGQNYPDPARFQVLIWGEHRGSFPQAPEEYYSGRTLCATGDIVSNLGIPEMEVASPAGLALR